MAARPVVGPITTDVYEGLPEVYRDADAGQADGPSNFPLLRYLSTILDQLDPVAELFARLAYFPRDDRDDLDGNGFGVGLPWQRYGTGELGDDTYGDGDRSDLADPEYANAGWLPWLAQLVGVVLPEGATIPQQRAMLATPSDSWARGTPAVITAAVLEVLPEGTAIAIVPHYGGNPWVIAILSDADPGTPTSTWGGLKSAGPTWGELQTIGSFAAAHTGAVTALRVLGQVEKARPAGYRFTYVNV